MRLRPAAALVLLVPLLLAGCGGAGTPRVASLSSTPPASGAATSPAGGASAPASGSAGSVLPDDPADTDTAPGRPQFRLDDTDARRTALVNAYSQCLIDHGATQQPTRGDAAPQMVPAGADGKPYIQVADPVPAAAKAACASKLPMMPPQVEAATNPHFHEQSLAYVACLKKHGEWVQLLNDHDLDWTYVEGHPVPDDNGTIEQDCLMEAFS